VFHFRANVIVRLFTGTRIGAFRSTVHMVDLQAELRSQKLAGAAAHSYSEPDPAANRGGRRRRALNQQPAPFRQTF
jgi:hypothetical protein